MGSQAGLNDGSADLATVRRKCEISTKSAKSFIDGLKAKFASDANARVS